MEGSVKGIPVVVIVLVLAIVAPLFGTMVYLHSAVMGELKQIKMQTVVATPEPAMEASPSAEITPTPTTKGKVIPQPKVEDSTTSAR